MTKTPPPESHAHRAGHGIARLGPSAGVVYHE
jgi:hypothetical protein